MINVIKSKKLNNEDYLVLASGIISNDLYVVAIFSVNNNILNIDNITIDDFDAIKRSLLFTSDFNKAIKYYETN